MKVESKFMMSRVGLLIRNALVLYLPSILLFTATLAGVLLLACLLDAYAGCSPQFHRIAFLGTFFPVGILLTSKIFRGVHDPVNGYFWLLLPSSSFEKTLSSILLTTLIYSLGSLVIYLLFSLVFEGINMLLFRRSHFLFNPLDPLVMKSIWTYTAVQAPFLAGAAYFKKHALSKTILVIVCILFILLLGILTAARVILGGGLSLHDFDALFSDAAFETFSAVGSGLIFTGKALFCLVLPAVSWTICYLRLRETEF